jgi:hypothetical protein
MKKLTVSKLNLGAVEVLLDLTLWWSWLVMSVNQLAYKVSAIVLSYY